MANVRQVTLKDPWKKYQAIQSKKMNRLLKNIKKNMPELEKMMESATDHWDYEDKVYRYYHQSFKVYWVQDITQRIVDLLSKISPNKDKTKFCTFFQVILDEGCGGLEFKSEHNSDWTKTTRPLLEAFFHAKYFLEMAIKYGKKYEEAPQMLDSGWAALLCLYDLR